ncbi:lysophospholipase [Streptomyces minutiscleroticus]|uniref:Lysophospholipase n=1 Tax=Streptomyces minutiscleroticus TaxID=68238 RepID=A0A918NS68_9ACTN|nr:lysophospholipase [Streptomyces minutiscleroticus]GGX90503.1 lysophospholipase [Streptomyces minutiscleroticus]
MTSPQPDVHSWDEATGVSPRGTLIVLPGRGEHGGLYERFGLRMAFDGYRVRALGDASLDPAGVTDAAAKLLRDETLPGPRVLVGADTGAAYAAELAAHDAPGLDGLVLAGLPTGPYPADAAGEWRAHGVPDWEGELERRTACSAHRDRLTADPVFRRGALAGVLPYESPALDRVSLPVLGLHGADDTVSPLPEVRRVYSALCGAELVSLAGTRHDVLNDVTHRTAAATVVLFLERLRLSPDLPPVAVPLDVA